MKDYFEILQIKADADTAAIEKAYRDMLVKYPADRYPEKNADIIQAYQMLTNPSTLKACQNFHRMGHTSKQVYKLAEQAMEEGRYDGAIKILDKIIKTEKNNDHLYHLLGIACMEAERYAKAVKAFDQVINKYPSDLNLLLHHTEACIASGNFKKAIASSKKGYEYEKNNILFTLYLVQGYVHTSKYAEAEAVLKEAMDNPEFQEKRYSLCTQMAFVLSLESKFNESLEYMEKLLTLDAGFDERVDSGEVLLNTLDFYLENQMYSEANRCMEVIIKLLPDREDIVATKKSIEKILKLEPEFCRFGEDDAVPEGLLGLLVNELFAETVTGMTEKQRKAYAVMNEYQILNDYGTYLMPLRYIKTRYPDLYDLKKEFFEELQDSKKRKVLKTKYQALVYQYQDIFEEMMEEWGEDLEDEEYEDEEPDPKEAQETGHHLVNQSGPAKEASNVRPFVRREDRNPPKK